MYDSYHNYEFTLNHNFSVPISVFFSLKNSGWKCTPLKFEIFGVEIPQNIDEW